MTYRSVSPTRQQGLRDALLEQMTTLVDAVGGWLDAQPRTLAELEQRTQAQLHHLGQALLTGLCAVQVSSYPVATVACRCGGVAQYQRQRAIQVHTLLGRVQVRRPYSLCPACHQGQAPLDAAWGVCANSVSAGLEQVLARLGVSIPFGEAAELAAWLLPVAVSPTTVASATERVGQAIAAAQAQAEATAWNQEAPQPPTSPAAGPERRSVSVDGTMVHLGEEGWKEAKLGTFSLTRAHPAKQAGEAPEVRAEQHSLVTDLCDAEAFGRLVWVEAARRGVLQATEVVVIGEGSHRIWNLAAEHFPQAVQMVDWYHASH